MTDIVFCTAFPKSGITYLNYMLMHALFDEPRDPARIDTDYIIDMHEHLDRVPPPGPGRRFVKCHAAFDPALPLRERAERVIYLARDPIDVMMSIWDFLHLLGHPDLLEAPQAQKDQVFRRYVENWVLSGGRQMSSQSWVENVTTWLDQREMPLLVVRYEALRDAPLDQLTRICAFLGTAVPPERLQLAAAQSAAGEMRKQEQREIDGKQAGAFYRPMLEKGYEKGFRFVGRLNANSYDTVLTAAERREADRVFGPVLARLDALAG